MKDVMAARIGAVRGGMAAAIRTEGLAAAKMSEIMSESFGGSDAAGAWDWRQAYDLMQAAALDVLSETAGGSGRTRKAVSTVGPACGRRLWCMAST